MTDLILYSKPFDWNDNLSKEALEDFEGIQKDLPYCTCQNIGMALAKLELLEEQGQDPKIGHWILTDDDFVYCSECEDSYYPRPIDASWNYCPHCGAKMAEGSGE